MDADVQCADLAPPVADAVYDGGPIGFERFGEGGGYGPEIPVQKVQAYGGAPFPEFPTPEQVQASSQSLKTKKTVVSRPEVKVSLPVWCAAQQQRTCLASKDKAFQGLGFCGGEVQETVSSSTFGASSTSYGGQQEEIAAPGGMGALEIMPQDHLETVTALPYRDYCALSMTCRRLRAVCEDGNMWKIRLQKHYPSSSLAGKSMDDWKYAYMLELCNTPGGALRCCETQLTHEEDMLALQLLFNGNEKDPNPAITIGSLSAFDKYQRHSRNLMVFPLYITADHFKGALPFSRSITPNIKFFDTGPGVDLLPFARLLDGMVAILCSHDDIQTIDRVIEAYCLMHRLCLAICDRYDLWGQADKLVKQLTHNLQARREGILRRKERREGIPRGKEWRVSKPLAQSWLYSACAQAKRLPGKQLYDL